jgi:hypothetical protein
MVDMLFAYLEENKQQFSQKEVSVDVSFDKVKTLV